MSLVQTSKCASLQEYVVQFLYFMQDATGFRKEAFTNAGVQLYLKRIAKTFYRCNLINEAVQMIIHIASCFGKSMKTREECVNQTVTRIVGILEGIANFYIMTYLGDGILIVTASDTGSMLKDWVLVLCKSKARVQEFLDNVFGTYGRAILA